MEFGKVSMKEQIVDKYLFGKDFEGKQKVWSVTVTPDRSDVVTLDMLQEDFDLVPMITGLDESIKKHNELFLTKDEHKTNILFINTSDNADNT